MSVSIVIGGQYGSEGKGKVAYFWAKKINAVAAVRVGGSNSGHTVYGKKGVRYALRMLPTASILGNVAAVLPAGSYIDVPVLMEEIRQTEIAPGYLKIDPNAVIITEEHKAKERELNLREKVGSTLSGTGVALMERVIRKDSLLRAKDVPELASYLCDTKKYLRGFLDRGENVIIEGTQGYGLSNYHVKTYPKVTSRDTTAAAFLAETGLSPLDVEHILMVIRAFPIRVAGHSGELEEEINWKTVAKESGAQEYFEEKTTVTHCVRRVARFTPDIVKEAIQANRPDIIVLNHMDYIDFSYKNEETLSEKQKMFLAEVEQKIGRKIPYCGNGEMKIIATEDRT